MCGSFKFFCYVLTGSWILVEVLHIAEICASETGLLCPAVSTWLESFRRILYKLGEAAYRVKVNPFPLMWR